MTLVLQNVSAGYGSADIIQDASLIVERGKVVAFIGANGAGKTTLAKAISGLIPCRRGSIEFDGVRIDQKSTADRMRLGIAHVPEGRQIFSGLTVEENLQLGGYLDRRDSAELRRRQSELVAEFAALRERLSTVAGNLSGGQQQMLAICRGLMCGPKLLILDEPSLGLAPIVVVEIFRLIARLREQGLSILLAEQNAYQSLAVADRGYVLENGRIVLSGSGNDLLQSREVVERYLGAGTEKAEQVAPMGGMASQLHGILDRI